MRAAPSLLLLWLVAGPAVAAGPGQVLIAPFPSGTLTAADGQALDQALRDGAGRVPGVEVQPRDQTQRALDAMRGLGLACNPDETRCLVQLGALGGVARVISTAAVRDGESLRVTLRLVDVAGKSEIRRIDGDVAPATAARDLEGLATGLLLPSHYKGRLRVEVNEDGAHIIVDGELRGVAPLTRPLEVRAGPVTVRVEKAGFAPGEQIVVVPFAGEARSEVTLTPGEGGESSFRARTRVLVLDFLVQGEGLPTARTLASLVAVELARDVGLDVLSGTDVDQLIAAQQAGVEINCQDTGCLTDLAGALDVPFIVHGDVGVVGSVLVVHLDVFDAQRVETVARTSIENTDRDELPDELKLAARRLLASARKARADFSRAAELPAPEQTAPMSAPSPLPVVGWSLVGVGGALALAGAVLTAVYGVAWYSIQTRLNDLGALVDAEQLGVDDAEVSAALANKKEYDDLLGPIVLPASPVVLGVGILTIGAGAALVLLRGDATDTE